MFDRLVVTAPRVTETHYDTVTEKRAPTDQSVALLREMETAARAEVQKAVAVGDNTFTCVVHFMIDQMADTVNLKALWMLNGVKEETKVSCLRFTAQPATLGSLLQGQMAKDIATTMLQKAFESAELYRQLEEWL